MNRATSILGLLIGLAACLPCVAQTSSSASFLDKPVRLIVPYPPGGGGDVVFRLITEPLAARLGRPVYMDYKPGASGTIGLNALAHSPADGYTLGVGSSDAIALAPNYYPKLGYDPIKDLQPIAIVAEMPLVLMVRTESPIKSYKDLVQMAKAKPGSISYGTPGAGSAPNIMGALLAKDSGIEITHIPYKGTAPAIQDMLGGQVDAVITSGFDSVPLEKARRARTIVVTGTQRYPLLPNTPTAREMGSNSLDDLKVWFGIFSPSSVPKPMIERYAKEIDQIINKNDFKARSADLGFVPIRITPEEFVSRVRADTVRLANLVKRTGVKPD